MQETRTKQSEETFLKYFNALPGIQPEKTDIVLAEALIEQTLRTQRNGVFLLKCKRGIGVTRMLLEFAKWTQLSVVVVSYNLQVYRAAGVKAFSWHHSLKGITPKPDLVLIDSPLSRRESESKTIADEFEQFLVNCPSPAFIAIQS